MTLLNACVVCLETKKMMLKHRITNLQEPEYSFVNFTVSITQVIHLQILVFICS